MTAKKSVGIVKEPVQVYLSESDRAALDRVAVVTGLPRAEIRTYRQALISCPTDAEITPTAKLPAELRADLPAGLLPLSDRGSAARGAACPGRA